MVLSDSQCRPVSELKGLLYHGLMARLSAIRHFLIAGHFNRSIKSDVVPDLRVTAVEFKSHAHPALWVVMWNNLDKLGSNRIEPVYYWREVVTVTIKHLKKKKKKNKTTKLELQRLTVRKNSPVSN